MKFFQDLRKLRVARAFGAGVYLFALASSALEAQAEEVEDIEAIEEHTALRNPFLLY